MGTLVTMQKTYLFYDIETTGLNPCFDQVLEFAAIRTDMELHELERYDLKVKLNPDVVPAPGAVITHRIGVEKSLSGISELAAITQIHKLFNTPGTISLGYNTLGFDDEFLRFSFYRNLLPPYTHQFANHCSRMDLYPLTVMYYLFKPNVLEQWPQQNQQISLKLANLSEANGLAQGQAHTAIVDVEATLALAKKFIQERSTWEYLTAYFNKDTDLARLTQLTQDFNVGKTHFQEALLVDGKFGAKQNFLAPVLHLGPHTQYKNQLWLRLDLENLTQTTTENIAENTFVIRKKPGERELLLPMKSRYLLQLSPERQQLVHQNKLWLSQNPEILTAICTYHRQYTYPKVPDTDAHAMLYTMPFPTTAEAGLFQKFHQAPPEKKMLIAGQFPNPIYQELALRMMGRHFYQHLTASNQELFNEYLQKSLHPNRENAPIDYRGQRKLTLPVALTEMETLKNSALTPDQLQLLTELNQWAVTQSY
jgi:exodeoxyribonuclease I